MVVGGLSGGLAGCGPGPAETGAPTVSASPTKPAAPTDTPAPAATTAPAATPSPADSEQTGEEATEKADFGTVFPLPDNVQNFIGEGGESQVNFQTNLTKDEAITFYRDAFAEMNLSEYELLTAIEDESFSMVFTGWPSGEGLVIQGVVFGDSTNVNIRLEEVIE
jgi:hypothetical protein